MTLADSDEIANVAYHKGLAEGPTDKTRELACLNPFWAYKYALDVDKAPRDDTRTAALGFAKAAFAYAALIDKKPRDDTRTAACANGYYAWKYAMKVDCHLTPETEAAMENGDVQDQDNLEALRSWGPGRWLAHTKPAIHDYGLSVHESTCARLLEAMYAQPAQPPAIVQKIPISRADLEVVAACLIGEAGGEGEKGLQAVMNVVYNRAGGDPARFKSVVLAPKQFSAMNSATGRRPKNSVANLVAMHKKHPLWSTALMTAHRASYKQLPDMTQGSTHYHASAIKPSWAGSMQPVGYLGGHIFYKPKKQ